MCVCSGVFCCSPAVKNAAVRAVKKLLCFQKNSDTISNKLCIHKGPLRVRRKGVMLMNKKRRVFLFSVLPFFLLLFLSSCESDSVSYSVDGGAEAASERSAENSTEYPELSGAVSSASDPSVSDSAAPDPAEAGPSEAEQETGEAQIQVYICGAVANPGVYTMPEGSRVYEAVAMAGGFLETADLKALNQARILSDCEQVTVLTVEEVQNGAAAGQGNAGSGSADGNGGSGGSNGEKVNINTADEAGLMTIPGIGESRAKAIIAYREENGKFQSVEEIMKIDGIKEKMFEKIKDSITV